MESFARAFDRDATLAVRAPGRVNLIGEHTDYNDGLVMPFAIQLDTAMWLAPRNDRKVRLFSLDLDESASFDIDAVLHSETGSGAPPTDWSRYAAGPVHALGASGRDTSRLRGFDAVISSRVPIGSGLSSSAALGLAAARALADCNELDLTDRELAELAWHGERDYVGIGCGVLDFHASALGRSGKALRIDCLDRSVREVEFPADVEILIAHSGVSRSLATSRYAERVAECTLAVEQARRAGRAAARSLRDFAANDLPELERQLDPTPFRRARHVIEENERVDRFAAALAERRFTDAGRTLRDAMESLRSNYDASVPELDVLCAAGDAADGCFGSRLTGAGWGGCSLHLIEAGAGTEVAALLGSHFNDRFGRVPSTWTVRASQGAESWLPGVSDARPR